MRLVCYHGSCDKFERIDLSKSLDIGFHCGTYEQALTRIKDKYGIKWNKNKFIYLVDIDISENEVLDIEKDIFNGFASNASLELFRILCIKCKRYFKLKEIKGKKYMSFYDMRERLLKNGIRVLKYKNEFEGDGYSYVILDDTTPIDEINHLNILYHGSN